MPADLTDDERAALIELLLRTIENDRFPISPRIKRLTKTLAKPASSIRRPSRCRRRRAVSRAELADGEEAEAKVGLAAEMDATVQHLR